MILLEIPGRENIEIKNVVFDYNGTIAEDGIIVEAVKDKIMELLSCGISVFVLTADTYGTVDKQCEGLAINVESFDKANASKNKREIVKKIGYDHTVTIGNGRNDMEMFQQSVISIAVIGREGCFSKALFEADIVVNNPIDAINLLLKQNRMKATLRN